MSFDADRLKELMDSSGSTLAVAESLTSGRVQAAVGQASGASSYFRGGITAYSVAQKARHLQVDLEHAESVDAVSERVAEEMARGVAVLFDSEFSVSTTGYAEPNLSKGIKEPFAHVAIWRRVGDAGTLIFSGVVTGRDMSRVEMQKHVAEFVLSRLQDHLDTNESGPR